MAETIYIVDPLPDERRRIADALANEPVLVECYDSAEQFLDQVAASASGCVLAPLEIQQARPCGRLRGRLITEAPAFDINSA